MPRLIDVESPLSPRPRCPMLRTAGACAAAAAVSAFLGFGEVLPVGASVMQTLYFAFLALFCAAMMLSYLEEVRQP